MPRIPCAHLLFIFICLVPTGNTFAQSDSGHYFASFDGTNIYFQVKGEGYPVILVHGFTGNGATWKKTALYEDLVNKNFKVITLDLRGNGRSDKPHLAEAYANDAEAKDIMLLASNMNLNNYSAVGYSRGSIIVARLLVLDKRLEKAVLGGMGLDFTNPEWPRRKMFYRALMGDSVKELESMVKHVQSSGLDQLALAYQQKEQPSTSQEALASITIPVLVICGQEDTDNGSAQSLMKIIPGSVYTAVPGDHGSASRSKEFAAAVSTFLLKKTK